METETVANLTPDYRDAKRRTLMICITKDYIFARNYILPLELINSAS